MTGEQIETKEPIDVKQAVSAAKHYVGSLYPQSEIYDLSLEEVERGDDGYWYITIGFSKPVQLPLPRATTLRELTQVMTGPSTERSYKVVKVDPDTGEPVSMKIRKL